MPPTIFAKVSSQGQRIEVKRLSQHTAGLWLDGKQVMGSTTQAIKLQQAQGNITHWMGGQAGKVGLTSTEAKVINDAVALLPLIVVDPATEWGGEASMDAAHSIF